MGRKRMGRDVSEVITFRFPAEVIAEIDEARKEAEGRMGRLSTSRWIRHLVMRGLEVETATNPN